MRTLCVILTLSLLSLGTAVAEEAAMPSAPDAVAAELALVEMLEVTASAAPSAPAAVELEVALAADDAGSFMSLAPLSGKLDALRAVIAQLQESGELSAAGADRLRELLESGTVVKLRGFAPQADTERRIIEFWKERGDWPGEIPSPKADTERRFMELWREQGARPSASSPGFDSHYREQTRQSQDAALEERIAKLEAQIEELTAKLAELSAAE